MGERLLCKQEVVGSIPSGSTSREFGSSAEKIIPYPSLCQGLNAPMARDGYVISDIVKR